MKKIILILLSCFATVALAETECEKTLKKLDPSWEHGKVSVPFNWNEPGESIEVYYYHKKQTDYKGKIPVVFFNGGPTVAGTVAIPLFAKIKEFDDQNLILIDQRGTGCSTNFKTYNSASNIETYKHYASDSIVKDAEVIRRKLFGEEKWKIFGQSYGGLISFRYLQLFPQSIESAHIHGFGFALNSKKMLDVRERRIAELTSEFLDYRNPAISDLSVREIVAHLRKPENAQLFATICVTTVGAVKDKFCGEDVFTGLFLITGFKDRWSIVHKNLFELSELLETNNVENLKKVYDKFVRVYILRFNDPNQAAALHAITFYEMMPQQLFYDGCSAVQENDFISECRYHRNFLIRLHERPAFESNPHDLVKIRENIKMYKMPIYYYAGVYDSFLPVNLLKETAEALDIESSLTIFKESGHDGFYSEKLVIENVVK